MAKTRAQLRTSIEALIGRTDKTTVLNDALDFALQEASDRHLFSELWSQNDESIVSGATSVAFTTGSRTLIEARFVDSTNESAWDIEVYPKELFVDAYPDVSSMNSSKPIVGYIEGTTLHFAPPSDGSYTIRMTTVAVPTFADDSSTSAILGIDEFLIAYSASYAFDSIELPESAQIWTARWISALGRAITNDRRRPAVTQQLRPHGIARKTRYLSSDPAHDPFVKAINVD